MARRVIGLDLGAYSVKLVRLECGKQTPKFEVVDQAEEILPISETDERDLLAYQKDAVLNLAQKGLLDAETCAVALNAAEGQMRIMKTPFLDSRKIEAVLPGLLEAELPFEVDNMTISWHRCEEPVLEKGQEKPDSANIRIAFGKKPAISNSLQMLQGVPLDPRFFHLASVAHYELARELGFETFSCQTEPASDGVSAIVDLGHRSTSVCVFDRHGLRFSRSFMRGGEKLTHEIAKELAISFTEAEKLKHEKIDLLGSSSDPQSTVINRLAHEHYHKLCDELTRAIISLKTSGSLAINSVMFVGGGSCALGLREFLQPQLSEQSVTICPAENLTKYGISSPAMAMPFSLALSCLQIHAKESRFNFRKDEFAWRGDLDFLRTKSTPLILWALVLICSMTVMWSANSLVLQKENSHVEQRLKSVCMQILGQADIAPKKCLAMMQEQIATSTEVGIPEFTASDIYIKTAEMLPKELNVAISEMDVLDKKVRITAEVASFEDVDKVAANLGRIPCLVNIEKGSAQKKDAVVKVNFSSDIDCNPAQPKSKPETEQKPKAKSETTRL
jgi:general secretion pathway protein L